MPFGAQTLASGGARFQLWAPAARSLELELEAEEGWRALAMERGSDGDWSLELARVRADARYRYRVDGEVSVPDPASRFQPDGLRGPSQLVDPTRFDWSDSGWLGRPIEEGVFYELHVGTFSPPGTFRAVAQRLDHLAQLGVTALELLPLGEFPGRRGWGYDGVLPFAPFSGYGNPDDLKALIAAAHARGLMVLVDVIYNHFGPEGNWLARYAPQFFSDRIATPWGAAIDFAGPCRRHVRDFFVHNALYWLEEFHFDGLRLDAVHAIHDPSKPDFLDELALRVRAALPSGRQVHLVLENDRNAAERLARDESGRPPLYTAQWNDDEHHALHVLLTGETAGYYADYAAEPLESLSRCLASGFAFQGEASPHRGGAPRGSPSGALPPTAFVPFLQNHDQIGNRALGERLVALCEPDALRAAVALLLLAPSPPLLFMGEEWGCAQPFPYFCDLEPALAAAVREGRSAEFATFPEFADPRARARIPDPGSERSFRAAVLRWDLLASARARGWLRYYRRLLSIRAREIAPRLRGMRGDAGRCEPFGPRALAASWTLGDGATLTLHANLDSLPATAPPPHPRGKRLFLTHTSLAPIACGALAPWTVEWFLEPP